MKIINPFKGHSGFEDVEREFDNKNDYLRSKGAKLRIVHDGWIQRTVDKKIFWFHEATVSCTFCDITMSELDVGDLVVINTQGKDHFKRITKKELSKMRYYNDTEYEFCLEDDEEIYLQAKKDKLKRNRFKNVVEQVLAWSMVGVVICLLLFIICSIINEYICSMKENLNMMLLGIGQFGLSSIIFGIINMFVERK